MHTYNISICDVTLLTALPTSEHAGGMKSLQRRARWRISQNWALPRCMLQETAGECCGRDKDTATWPWPPPAVGETGPAALPARLARLPAMLAPSPTAPSRPCRLSMTG